MSQGALAQIGLETVMDAMEVGILLLDAQTRVLHCNRWLARRAGLPEDGIGGRPLHEIFPTSQGTRLAQAVRHATQDRLPSLLSPALNGTLLPLYLSEADRRAGRRMQQLIHVMPILDETQQPLCLIQITDTTANMARERLLRQQTETLRRKTTQDPLTGAINRRTFDDTLATEFHAARQKQGTLGLMIVDLDGFSDYNAHYGRERGDACLVEIATLIKDVVRPFSDQVARYGGDEFAVMLPGIDERKLRGLAESLRLRIGTLGIANASGGKQPHLTVSIGVTVMRPDAHADTHTLPSSADVALYQAKHEGKNRAIYFSADDAVFSACG